MSRQLFKNEPESPGEACGGIEPNSVLPNYSIYFGRRSPCAKLMFMDEDKNDTWKTSEKPPSYRQFVAANRNDLNCFVNNIIIYINILHLILDTSFDSTSENSLQTIDRVMREFSFVINTCFFRI